jgi:hypothetical protein
MASLDGKKIAFLVAQEGVEEVELTKPWEAVERAGGTPELIAPKAGDVQAFNHLDKGSAFPVENTLADARPSDYDGVVLPGCALRSSRRPSPRARRGSKPSLGRRSLANEIATRAADPGALLCRSRSSRSVLRHLRSHPPPATVLRLPSRCIPRDASTETLHGLDAPEGGILTLHRDRLARTVALPPVATVHLAEATMRCVGMAVPTLACRHAAVLPRHA